MAIEAKESWRKKVELNRLSLPHLKALVKHYNGEFPVSVSKITRIHKDDMVAVIVSRSGLPANGGGTPTTKASDDDGTSSYHDNSDEDESSE